MKPCQELVNHFAQHGCDIEAAAPLLSSTFLDEYISDPASKSSLLEILKEQLPRLIAGIGAPEFFAVYEESVRNIAHTWWTEVTGDFSPMFYGRLQPYSIDINASTLVCELTLKRKIGETQSKLDTSNAILRIPRCLQIPSLAIQHSGKILLSAPGLKNARRIASDAQEVDLSELREVHDLHLEADVVRVDNLTSIFDFHHGGAELLSAQQLARSTVLQSNAKIVSVPHMKRVEILLINRCNRLEVADLSVGLLRLDVNYPQNVMNKDVDRANPIREQLEIIFTNSKDKLWVKRLECSDQTKLLLQPYLDSHQLIVDEWTIHEYTRSSS